MTKCDIMYGNYTERERRKEEDIYTNIRSGCGPGVHCHNNTVLEFERQCGGAMVKVNLHIALGIRKLLQVFYWLQKYTNCIYTS